MNGNGLIDDTRDGGAAWSREFLMRTRGRARRPGRLAWVLVFACLGCRGASGEAGELPAPEQLLRESGIPPQSITVIEPHESGAGHAVEITYTAIPLVPLLDRWFGARWSEPGTELLFFARDGYRSAIAASDFKQRRALLAFARSDGAVFVVNNAEQNQSGVPLGPYYVIWDNRSWPDRVARGTYGWPYQVTRIELRAMQDDRSLLPANPGPDLEDGFADTKKFCLNCHMIRGVGGGKYPGDLAQAACRWNDGQLKDWIREPSRVRPGTTMPALHRDLPHETREQTVTRIVSYLRAISRDDDACRPVSPPPPPLPQ